MTDRERLVFISIYCEKWAASTMSGPVAMTLIRGLVLGEVTAAEMVNVRSVSDD